MPIVLSGIVQSNAESITTKLEVDFLFHLPYKLMDGDSASLMVATGPNVSVSTIIGLPFMKASGMTLDLVDKVVECKYLDCPSFPVDFQRTSNHIPSIMDDQSGTLAHHPASSSECLQEIENLECYYNARVQGCSSLITQNQVMQFGLRPAVHVAARDPNNACMASYPAKDMTTWWVPPPSIVKEDSNDYPASVLRKDGWL